MKDKNGNLMNYEALRNLAVELEGAITQIPWLVNEKYPDQVEGEVREKIMESCKELTDYAKRLQAVLKADDIEEVNHCTGCPFAEYYDNSNSRAPKEWVCDHIGQICEEDYGKTVLRSMDGPPENCPLRDGCKVYILAP